MESGTPTVRKSLCRICTAQCPIEVELDAQGRPVRAWGDKSNPHSEGFFCLKGKHFPEMHTSPERLLHSQKRGADGQLAPISAERAMDEVAEKLASIIERHGRRSVAVYCGTLFYQLPQTAGFATAWMDALRLSMRFNSGTIDQPGKQTAQAAHGLWLGGSFSFDESDVWMLVGTNPLVAISGGVPHANPARRLKRARERGLELVVIDPRRTETAAQATLHIQPRPGQDPAILAGILREVIAQGHVDEAFVREHTEGFERLREAVEPFHAERVAARADIPAEQIVHAARIFGTATRGSVTAGTGANMSGWSNVTEYLVLCLNTVCGRYRRAGDAVRNPGILTTAREFRAQAFPPLPIDGYGKPMRTRDMTPAICGLPTSALADEILEPGDDRVRALVTIGGNPMRAWPDPVRTRRALEALDLHVAIEPRRTDTARLAHYVLAPKLPLETPGCSLSTENLFTVSPALGYTDAYAQYAAPVVEPPEGSELLEDWEFFYGLAQRMGLELEVKSGVFPIMGVETPRTRIDMERKPNSREALEILAKGSRVPLADVERETAKGRVFYDDWIGEPVRVAPPDAGAETRLCLSNEVMLGELSLFEAGDRYDRSGFPYRLISRRMANTFNSVGTDIAGLVDRYGTNPAFLHPDDLAREGLGRGDRLCIRSPHGEIEAVAWPDPGLRRGLVSMCHAWGPNPGEDDGPVPGVNVGRLISVEEDCAPFSGIPLMSALPVSIAASSHGR